MRTAFAAVLLMVSAASSAQDMKGFATPRFVCDVHDYGAKGGGDVLETAPIQKAIDACAAAGGGTVRFGFGTYFSGTLRLKSGVYLSLEDGAVIKGSPRDADYDQCGRSAFHNDADFENSCFDYALIRAEDAEHIGIVGKGTIDANRNARFGPKPVSIKRCRFVDIESVHIVNSPSYSLSLLGTDDVVIDGITILNSYADGIDPDSCRNVRISNTHIESRDDSIAIKTSFSLGYRRSSENISIDHCYLSSKQNCFKMGSETGGDIRHVTVADTDMSSFRQSDATRSGVAIESVDGANIDDVTIANVRMNGTGAPIFIHLGGRLRDHAPSPGSIKNVVIKDLEALNASKTSSVTGIPGFDPDGITLSDIRVVYAGDGQHPVAGPGARVPEDVKGFPTPNMFGPLPAYGFYARHVDGLSLSNVQFQAGSPLKRLLPSGSPRHPAKQADPPAMAADDVRGLRLIDVRDASSADSPAR